MTTFRPLTPAELTDLYDMLAKADEQMMGNNEALGTAVELLKEAIIPDPEPEAEPLRGLRASVYHSAGGSCSNGGISSWADEVVLVGPGIPEIVTATQDMPAVEIDTISFARETTYHVRPAGEPGKHYMFGGSFIHSSDSRFRKMFPFNGAVALHDRHEG